MSYFVEVDGDMGAYDMTELEAWKRYSQEIIDAKENGETYSITIGESLEDGAFEQYEYDESTFDSYCDWVLEQIVNAALAHDDDCPHCGFDRGDHDISDRNRLIPCESDGERD